MTADDEPGDARFAGLTPKQRQVLDLLIEHKTSKEIARLLGISPHTVDQRIFFAKDKLGANSRNEAAVAYRQLVYGRTTYQDSDMVRPHSGAEAVIGSPSGLALALSHGWPRSDGSLPHEADYRVVPELFEGRYGTLMRLSAIIAIAVFMVILVLGGLAIFSELSRMMAG